MNVNQRLWEREVAHQIGLSRYSAATVRKIVALLGRLDTDVQDQLTRFAWDDVVREQARRARLDKLLEAVRIASREAHDALHRTLRHDLGDLAKYEAEFQAKAVADATSGRLAVSSLVLPRAEELNAAVNARPFQGRLLKEWSRDLDEATFKRVRDAIRIGFVEGESVAEVARRLRGTKALNYKDGILDMSKRGAEGLVRTAVTHTANAAKEEFYKANGDHIRGLRWSSVLDRRTSAVCRGRDGQVFEVGKGPRPPAHWNCRSVMVAELKGEPAYEGTTYTDWLKKQPVEMQDDILGKAKGQLFRKGGLALDRFIDRAGQEYTLDELRRREADAFARAGLA